MLNNKTRRDVIFNRVPTKADLDAGDLVVNAGDGIAYTKLVTGQVVPIAGRSISGDSGGSFYELPIATPTVLGGIKVGANLSITADGVLSAQQGQDGFVLMPATRSTLGGVIVGARLTVGPDGTLSADAQSIPIASTSVLGGVRVGQGLTIDGSGLLTANAQGFVLPPATNTVLGGIRVGTNLTVTADGTLNAGPSGSDRVMRTGDTMTGRLTMTNNRQFFCEAGSQFQAQALRDWSSYFFSETTDRVGWTNHLFDEHADSWSYAGRRNYVHGDLGATLRANAGEVVVEAVSDNVRLTAAGVHYTFAPWAAEMNRPLLTRSSNTDAAIIVRENANNLSSISFRNWDHGWEWAAVVSTSERADFWCRRQAWLRAGADDGWGHAEINGGWREWEAVRFSRGGQWLGSVDGNGNYINKVSRVEALPASVAGLDVVLQLHPVVFASGTTDGVERPPSLGFLPTELRRAIPEAAPYEDGGYCAAALIPVLVKAVQELAARVAELEAA